MIKNPDHGIQATACLFDRRGGSQGDACGRGAAPCPSRSGAAARGPRNAKASNGLGMGENTSVGNLGMPCPGSLGRSNSPVGLEKALVNWVRISLSYDPPSAVKAVKHQARSLTNGRYFQVRRKAFGCTTKTYASSPNHCFFRKSRTTTPKDDLHNSTRFCAARIGMGCKARFAANSACYWQ